jgi:putative PEP-CTERM system histidine kinase
LTEELVFVPIQMSAGSSATALSAATTRSIVEFFRDQDWIVDLDEYRADAGQYPGLDLANDLAQLRNARLLVPLFVEEKLFALAALGQPAVNIDLGWEDFNILKVVGRQVGGYLALQHADRVLSESKQFRAMNQVSAFIVHDLKTVTAQLSLMLRNAEKHSSNPAFVADMLRTTDNAVARMNRLLAQLRETRQEPERSEVDLVAATREALASCERREPCPRFDAPREPVPVTADRERLVAAIGHIVKNAQEATPESGDVHVTIRQDGSWVAVEVTDTGCGMTPEFITKQLFTPFTTTKGLSGMGIGTYQAREYLRSLGGDVSVTSAPGRGTSFTLRLPSPAAVQLAGAPS